MSIGFCPAGHRPKKCQLSTIVRKTRHSSCLVFLIFLLEAWIIRFCSDTFIPTKKKKRMRGCVENNSRNILPGAGRSIPGERKQQVPMENEKKHRQPVCAYTHKIFSKRNSQRLQAFQIFYTFINQPKPGSVLHMLLYRLQDIVRKLILGVSGNFKAFYQPLIFF